MPSPADNPYPQKLTALDFTLKHRGILEKVLIKAGINYTTWWRWKSGKSEPRAKQWRQFQAALPVDLRDVA